MRATPINLIPIVCFFLCSYSYAYCSEATLINFKQLNPIEARQDGKKIMASFTADWCLPCKVMKTSLYNDPEIAALVNDNFQPVLIDVDSTLGKTWDESYNISYLPSIIFTDASGNEFERIKGTPSKEEFMHTLRRIISKDKTPIRASDLSKTMVPKTKIMESNGFARAIQLGAFSTMVSAERRMNDLVTFRDEAYIIIQEETNGRLLYKVVHEVMLSEEESISMLKHYLDNGFEAFLRPG